MTTVTVTPAEAVEIAALRIEIDSLYAGVKARPATEIETRIRDTASGLIDAGDFPRFPFEPLIYFRMTEAEKRREAALIVRWNVIITRAKIRNGERRQAKINAREVASIRAAACPVCFSTHTGEC
jgi:hypothetical protein